MSDTSQEEVARIYPAIGQLEEDTMMNLRGLMSRYDGELRFDVGDETCAFRGVWTAWDGRVIEFAMVRQAYQSVGISPRRLALELEKHIVAKLGRETGDRNARI